MPQPLLQHILHHNLSELPTEIILRIFEFLPSSSLTALLLTSVHTSLVATAVLSSRSHHINDLEDLRSFTHDIPFLLIPWFMTSSHFSESKTSKYSTYSVNSAKKSTSFSPYFSHQLKRKQLGPIFYRAGTMILFAKHFTRLIPEARLLLGFGYAMVLAWFMCLFYLVPFWGALSLYFAMDLVDLFSRSMAIFIHSLPLSMLCFFLPKSHPLHPQQPPEAPRVPAQLIRRLKFSASAHITPGQNEPLRCCGLAGTGWDLDRYEIDPNVDTTITGKAATANLTQPSTIHSNTKPTPFWGLMSSYTPWHLYLLTHTLSLHPAIQNLTLSRISLAWWFRLHPVPHLQILILHACELDETGIGLVAQAFPGLLGLVLRGSEVRCGGWDVESIRRGSADRTSSSTIPSLHSQTNTPPEYLGTPTGWWSKHRTVKNGPDPSVTHFTSLRIVRFEMCPASCAVDAVRMVLDRCPTVERIEFVGCGLEEETFLEGNVSGVVVEFERIAFDRAGSYKAGSLWWEGQSRFAEKIETVIKRTGCQIVNKTQSSDNEIDEEQEFAPASTPPGFRKCIVIQGQALFGLRDKWYIHVRASRVWGQ
ncbi:hypothetical protein BCR33DRAFT_845677 [Rhizoclosmatium globosum]|uniref:F-box domain-containing protein n=1 Tax=Rhizoclosmatium globosum TaxID=329046 RepID=A0A1Y2D1T5_9FUNG|nr:hypothetical protein BCR33DRAFT_845677 [Rhizoclosmatium globosum]|eukprot:ORY52545.1 hypothetical protein BCR33DRAFT_845677 [Rhizoclosmatium globosum]